MSYPLIQYPIIYGTTKTLIVGDTLSIKFSFPASWVIDAIDEVSTDTGKLVGYSDSIEITGLKKANRIIINILGSTTYGGIRNGTEWVDSDLNGSIDYWETDSNTELISVDGAQYGFAGQSGMMRLNSYASPVATKLYIDQLNVAPTIGIVKYSGKYRSTKPVAIGIAPYLKEYPATDSIDDVVYAIYTSNPGTIKLATSGLSPDKYMTFTNGTYIDTADDYEVFNLSEGYNVLYSNSFENGTLIHPEKCSNMMVDTSFVPYGLKYYKIAGDNIKGDISNLYFIKESLIISKPFNNTTALSGDIASLSGISEEIMLQYSSNIYGNISSLTAKKIDVTGLKITGRITNPNVYYFVADKTLISKEDLESSLITLATGTVINGTFTAMIDMPTVDSTEVCAAIAELLNRGWVVNVNKNCGYYY